ncbi:MAG: ATP-dependent zinc protease [Pseudomonadota bacterium]
MSDTFTLGWVEWLALPSLGLPAIKAKIDTGARSSALHAQAIEPFGPGNARQVRFLIQPDPDNPALERTCSAPIIDHRRVTSSNGEAEERYVIETPIEIGGRRWPIEITLTNRDSMAYRMLLGRSAMAGGVIVDPNRSFAQPQLTFDAYNTAPTHRSV